MRNSKEPLALTDAPESTALVPSSGGAVRQASSHAIVPSSGGAVRQASSHALVPSSGATATLAVSAADSSVDLETQVQTALAELANGSAAAATAGASAVPSTALSCDTGIVFDQEAFNTNLARVTPLYYFNPLWKLPKAFSTAYTVALGGRGSVACRALATSAISAGLASNNTLSYGVIDMGVISPGLAALAGNPALGKDLFRPDRENGPRVAKTLGATYGTRGNAYSRVNVNSTQLQDYLFAAGYGCAREVIAMFMGQNDQLCIKKESMVLHPGRFLTGFQPTKLIYNHTNAPALWARDETTGSEIKEPMLMRHPAGYKLLEGIFASGDNDLVECFLYPEGSREDMPLTSLLLHGRFGSGQMTHNRTKAVGSFYPNSSPSIEQRKQTWQQEIDHMLTLSKAAFFGGNSGVLDRLFDAAKEKIHVPRGRGGSELKIDIPSVVAMVLGLGLERDRRMPYNAFIHASMGCSDTSPSDTVEAVKGHGQEDFLRMPDVYGELDRPTLTEFYDIMMMHAVMNHSQVDAVNAAYDAFIDHADIFNLDGPVRRFFKHPTTNPSAEFVLTPRVLTHVPFVADVVEKIKHKQPAIAKALGLDRLSKAKPSSVEVPTPGAMAGAGSSSTALAKASTPGVMAGAGSSSTALALRRSEKDWPTIPSWAFVALVCNQPVMNSMLAGVIMRKEQDDWDKATCATPSRKAWAILLSQMGLLQLSNAAQIERHVGLKKGTLASFGPTVSALPAGCHAASRAGGSPATPLLPSSPGASTPARDIVPASVPSHLSVARAPSSNEYQRCQDGSYMAPDGSGSSFGKGV